MESYEYHINIDSVMDRILQGKNLKSEIDKFVVVDPAFATTRYFFIKIFILKQTSEATEDKLKVSPTVLQENPAVPISSLAGCNIKET